MRASHVDSVLRQVYRRHREPSASHQAELEARLTARFRKEAARLQRKRPIGRRLLTAAMACGATVAASQVPVWYSVRVGELLTISIPAGAAAPRPDLLMPLLQQGGSMVARVRIRREASGVVMVAQVWGETLARDLPQQVHAACPAAQVTVTALRGSLRGTVLDKIRYELLDLSDPQKIAQARAAALRELAARGESARVDISVREGSGPRILVKRDPRDGRSAGIKDGVNRAQ